MGLALIADPQSFSLSSFISSLGWRGVCLLIFRGKHCSLSNAARFYEELLIKWIHPAAKENWSGKKKDGRRQKGHFLATIGFSLHFHHECGLGFFSSQNFKARLLDFAHEQRAYAADVLRGAWPKEFGLSLHQTFKISSPQGTFYLADDLWGTNLQPFLKQFSITWTDVS